MRHRSPARVVATGGVGGGPLPPRFERHLRGSGLIRPGEPVLVALSGGVDSMVLLALLRTLRREWRLDLRAAHFDHRIRPESGEEAEWIASICDEWEVPLEVGVADPVPRGQDAARQARYHFLEEAAHRHLASAIATAHHANDQAETVLFQIARGSGLRGLAGIPPRRGLIVRPLLPFWRAEIVDYAQRAGIPYIEDPSNLLPDYTRNRIRHEVLPLLEEVVPGAARSLVRLSAEARVDSEGWDAVLDGIEPEVVVSAGEDEIVLARAGLLSYHPRIRGLLLRRLLRRWGSRPERAATEAILDFIDSGASGGEFHIAGGVRIAREFDHFRLSRVAEGYRAQGEERPLRIPGPGSGAGVVVLGGDRRLTIRWMMGDGGELANSAAFDPAEVRFPLEIRSWRPGDRIQLPYGTKKLKKLFVEQRIGRADRGSIPILAEVGGRVLWVAGVARAAVAEPVAGRPSLMVQISDAES